MELENLYRRYAGDVYRFAFWLSGNPADAEDITSETFVRAWAGATSLRAATVKGYLLTIARNLFLEQRRKRRPSTPLVEELPDRAPGPEVRAQGSGEIARLNQALQTLPEADRAALLMRAKEALPYAEIARALGIGLSAAKVKVHRARLKLSRLMDRPKRGGIER